MRYWSGLMVLTLFAGVFCAGSAAADDATAQLAVPQLAAPPPIDGRIGAAWATAATIALTTDFTNRRPAAEATTVRVAQDSDALDVAFDVTQSEPTIAATTTNGSSVTSDDYVEVALSPNGRLGFQYAFYANPRGARYQTSSENSAYAPPWSAAVATRAGGYTVTLRIPLAIIRSGGRTDWRAQFAPATVRTNALDVWAFSNRAGNVGDATFFGTLTGIGAHAAEGAQRPRARIQLYGLGEITPRSNGGDTSRLGADLSVPVAPTISVLASFHPDYSNVETDQQTITPTAFPRSFAEVRPFFTQAAQPFNSTFSCFNCPQLLYTPAIPTYRDAYALEGTQGPLTFAAFDAAGTGRDDSAAMLNYSASTAGLTWQHIGAGFDPLDAYIAQNDISGPQLYASQTIPFKAQTILHDLSFSTYEATFTGAAGEPTQNDLSTQVNADFRDLVTLHAYYGESAVRTFAGEFLPFDGTGGLVGFKYGTATPSYVQFTGGPYYHGNLDAWTYLATIPLAPKLHATLETDRTSYLTRYPGEQSGTQWLERASLDYQINRETQFDLGARRIIGPPLPVSFAPPVLAPTEASNISAAFHYLSRSGRDELHVVYGDSNRLNTTPALFAKYNFYVGAPKGT